MDYWLCVVEDQIRNKIIYAKKTYSSPSVFNIKKLQSKFNVEHFEISYFATDDPKRFFSPEDSRTIEKLLSNPKRPSQILV